MAATGGGRRAASDDRRDLRDLRLTELQALLAELGLPAFRARQVFSWIHRRGVTSTAPMTDLGKELRQRIASLGDLEPLQLEDTLCAADGTRKLRLRCRDGAALETVLIPEESKLTQCLSSQVGCGLGCRFCATASMGLRRNLRPGEIVDQVYRARELLPSQSLISNLVFMGMGEPLLNLSAVLTAVDILCTDLGANFSPRRITLSTAGVVPGIDELGQRAPQLGLAVSLNATSDEVRGQLMPINRRWPLSELLAALRRFPLPRRRRITIEYVLIAGLNDSDADARRLPRLLDRLRCKVNLIPFNPSTESPYARPSEEAVEAFAERLREKGLPTYLRRGRGAEIAAACGQLVAAVQTQ